MEYSETLFLQQTAGSKHGHTARQGYLQRDALIGRSEEHGAPLQCDVSEGSSGGCVGLPLNHQQDSSAV